MLNFSCLLEKFSRKISIKKIRDDIIIAAKKDVEKAKKSISDAEIEAIFEGAESIIKEELIKKEKKLKLLQQDEMIKKAGKSIEIEKIEPIPEISEEEIAKKFNFFIDLILLFLNSYIVKRGIDPIQTEEMHPLIKSLASLTAPKLAEAGEQLMEKIEAVEMLEKIFYLIKAIYDIIKPRYKSIKNVIKRKKEEGI